MSARSKRPTTTGRKAASTKVPALGTPAVDRLEEIERSGGDGKLQLEGGATLALSSLGKLFFPKERRTKGDVMRYYARVEASILPVMRDRPLVLKRYPNGIDGESFYQQNAPERVPPGVRVVSIRNERDEPQRRFIGGDLATLLYTIQLGAISVDPWHSRVPKLGEADFTIIDLDPGPKAPFSRVIEVAKLVEAELHELELTAVAKTSGSSGMHIVIPFDPAVSDETAVLAAQLIATRVAVRAPGIATIERTVAARAPGAIYVDYLQNIRGKTVAAAYSVRARPGATVSTPLEWAEIDARLDPRDFTIDTVPDRLRRHGDIWARTMTKGNSMQPVLEAVSSKSKSRR